MKTDSTSIFLSDWRIEIICKNSLASFINISRLNLLVKQVEKLSSNVVSLTQSIEIQTERIITDLNKLNTTAEYGNALREKANISSTQLVNDMNYIRNFAENVEIRRRNNGI